VVELRSPRRHDHTPAKPGYEKKRPSGLVLDASGAFTVANLLDAPGSKARADKQKGLKRGNETKGLRDQAKAQPQAKWRRTRLTFSWTVPKKNDPARRSSQACV
jgi:hypothetical protein